MSILANDFLWGGSISACQAEGGSQEGGRTLSITEIIPKQNHIDRKVIIMPKVTEEMIEEGLGSDDLSRYPKRNGIDFYHHYKEDIKLLGEMGFKVFRFSISWTRVYPDINAQEPNEEGLAFYDDVVSTCLQYNIQPLVTILHNDLPIQVATEYGGWINPKVIDLYLKYCQTLFVRFKGRVKYWVPINEINMDLLSGSRKMGIMKDDEPNFDELVFQGLHHEFVASAKAVSLAHSIDPQNKVGHMIAAFTTYPYTCKPIDNIATIEDDRMRNLFFLDVLNNGEYPYYIKNYWEKHNFHIVISDEHKASLKNHCADFIGVSYYNSMVSAYDTSKLSLTGGNVFNAWKNPHLDMNEWGWQIDPVGMRYMLHQIYDRYKKPIFILENGIGFVENLNEEKRIHDDYRIAYLKAHFEELKQAVSEGVDVMGYTMWGCIDLISAGTAEMAKRYGFIYVDQDDDGKGSKKRYPKDSFYWYQKVIQSNGEEL